jgi:hypothetical protein
MTGPRDELAKEEKERAQKALDEVKAKADADCPNLHKPKDVGCGTHFDNPNTKRANAAGKMQTPSEMARKEFTKGVRNEHLRMARVKFPDKTIPADDQVNHKTPLDAGGCPIGPHNTIPDGALSEECKRIDRLQGALQGRK